MVTKATPKTREQALAERRAEFDAIQQMQANRDAEQAEWQREHDEFAARVQARRDAIDTHIRRSWAQREDGPMTEREFNQARAEIEQQAFEQVKVEGSIPTIDSIYQAKAAQERAAAEEAERQRIAALSPRDVWLSTLPYSEQQKVLKWEGINKMPYPVATTSDHP